MVVALLALFVALGGPAQAKRLIDGSDIKRGSVGSKQLKDRSVAERDLARKTVRALRATPNRSIGAAKLADGAVTARSLAPDSVSSGHVGDNSLGAADLAVNGVGTDEIAENAVGQSEIRGNGVAAAEIADNSIDGGEIIDGGLSIRDVARRTGPFEWSVGPLAVDKCEPKLVPIGGSPLAGEFVLIAPVTPWPSGLSYAVSGSTDSGFRVLACNHTGAGFDGATYTFNYAVIGF
jgi:hypothetical protein